MKEGQPKATVGIDGGLYQRLKEIADRRRCAVDELVEESIKTRFRFHGAEERLAAVESIAGMELPVGDWDELEDEIIEGATEK